jgi:uracil-DNA glycosylase family 4
MPSKEELQRLLKEIRACTFCGSSLPLGPRPVLEASTQSKILLVGQAPGTKVHESGIPWNDKSGERLRSWLDMDKNIFYDSTYLAIIPMGFCYPGKGERGDLPPRPECAELWQEKLRLQLPNIKLTLAIGQYAIKYYLGKNRKKNLTETVKNWNQYFDAHKVIPLVHPSPRNIMWRRKNPWFEEKVIPQIREEVWKALST